MNSSIVKSLYYLVDSTLEKLNEPDKSIIETEEEDWQRIMKKSVTFKNALTPMAKKSVIIQFIRDKSEDFLKVKDEKEKKKYMISVLNMFKADIARRKSIMKRRTEIERRLGDNPIQQLETQISNSKDPFTQKLFKIASTGAHANHFPPEAYFEFLIEIRAKQFTNTNELKGCIKQWSAFQGNVKTLNSIDFSTICPKRQQMLDMVKQGIEITEGNNPTCIYCYVEGARDIKAKNPKYFLAKAEKDDLRYQGELKNLRQNKIIQLNKMGGLRFFSSGDYIENATTDAGIESMIRDAEKIGLQFKCITKQEKFVKKYGTRLFQGGPLKGKPVFNINISVDEQKGFPLTIAKQIKNQSKFGNIRIRVVAFNPQQAVKYAKDPSVDVITLLHFTSRGRMQNNELFVNMRPSSKGWDKAIEMIRAELGSKANIALSKLCCATIGGCRECPVACGFNPRKMKDFVLAAKGGKLKIKFPIPLNK